MPSTCSSDLSLGLRLQGERRRAREKTEDQLDAPPTDERWGAGHGISFWATAPTWLLSTQGDGYWRTTDSGATWKQVTDHNSMHGACIATYSKAGVMYVGANNRIMRSTDNGASFTLVGPRTSPTATTEIVSDGVNLFAQESNTGGNTAGPAAAYVTPTATA